MKEILAKYLPSTAVDPVSEMIKMNSVHLKIVNERVTRHGDYRRLPDGSQQITINANLNKYRFLITTIHEIAHLVAFQKYGRSIKPHGQEWKHCFRNLMLPFIRPEVFPKSLLPVIANHFRNPKASSDTDANLSVALKSFDDDNGKNYVFELPMGSIFKIHNGKTFKKGPKKIKRFECLELDSGRIFLFQPNAEVHLLKI
ncbi:SprT-like domain-containing protein [Christiangramia aquimixticola]|uniref:SprT-like domain-containing protein n=1 Tax=Christiangramia aquimixticola TaxID=1697558 RepID=UPI003AA9AEB7